MHVILVETSSVRGFDCVREMVDAGTEVTFLSADLGSYRGKPGAELMSYAARTIEVPGLAEAKDLAGQLKGRLGPTPVSGVVCREEAHAHVAACLARDLGLPHEDPDTALMLMNKAAVRDELDMAGLGGLAWRAVTNEEAGLAAAREIGYPVVVKPADGGWSIGVSVVWDEAAARRAFQEAMKPIPFAASKPPLILVEEYAVGRHVSAEILVQGDRVVMLGFAERVPAPAGTTAELGGHFPARFPGMDAAHQYAVDVVRALGIRCSAVHVEMLITPTGPALIEVNPRVAGHVVSHQISLALGRSLALDLADLATGRPVAEAGVPVATAALRQLFSETDGAVSSAARLDGLPPEAAMADVWVGPGDRVRAIKDNQDRFGYVVACGHSAAAADRVARKTAGALLAELNIRSVPEAVATEDAQDVGDPTGRHLLVLAGPAEQEDVPFERLVEAVSAVTDRISVVWISADGTDGDARRAWALRATGTWHHAASHEEAALLHERLLAATPVDGVLAAGPRLERLARRLRGEERVAQGPSPRATVEHAAHTVLVLATDSAGAGAVIPLGTIDESRRAGIAERCFPSALGADRSERLVNGAVAAVREAGAVGLVRCVFPGTDGKPLLLHGVDASTVDLFDAVSPRSLLVIAAEAALGRRPRRPGRRQRRALQRTLATPEGAFRVVASTPAEELFDLPGAFRVQVPLVAGDTHRQAAPATRLRFTVTAEDAHQAAARAEDLQGAHDFTTEALDRTHLLVLDRMGPEIWADEDGTPLFPGERYRLSVLTSAQGALTPAGQDFAATVNVFDTAAVSRLATAVHDNHAVHRVATVSERLLEPAALLRKRFSAAGDAPEQVMRFVDKAVMKQIARAAGVPHAAGRVLATGTDLMTMLDAYGTVVVKPRKSSGSQGVHVLKSTAEAEEWLRTARRTSSFLCEEYIPHGLCHIDAVVIDGEPIWDVSVYARDTFALHRGMPLSSYTAADPRLRSAAAGLLASVVDAWQVTDAVLHLEAFRSPTDELTFCEIAARPGGGGVADAFRATRGIHLDRAKLLLDAGEDPRRIRRDPVAEYAGFTLHYSPGGVLREFDDSAVADRAYLRSVTAEIGRHAAPSTFSGSGVSTHVFADDDPDEVLRLIELAESRIRVVVENPPTTESACTT